MSTSPAGRWTDHSFVVLAYGDSPFLGGCLRSLKAQTETSSIIVATSTPSGAIAAEAARAGAELLVNPDRRDIAGDWNFALRAAETRYVTLAHQDDVYAPEFLTATHALFADHPGGAVAFTGYQEIDDEGRPKGSKVSVAKHAIEAVTIGRRRVATGLRLRLFLSFGNPLPCSSATFDREALGDFAFSDRYASNLDWEAWWRLRGEGKMFLHAPERFVGRRHNQLTETSRLIRDGRRQREDAEMFARIWPRPIDRAMGLLYARGYQ